MIMAGFLNSLSQFPTLSQEHPRKISKLNSKIPELVTFFKNKSVSNASVSTKKTQIPLPSWKSSKEDTRTDKIISAYHCMEEIVEKGLQVDSGHSYKLIHALCKANELRKATKVIELMIRSGCIPEVTSYAFIVNHLCKRGYVGHAVQLVDEMRCYGYGAGNVSYNCLLRVLCSKKRLDEVLQFFHSILDEKLLPNTITFSVLLETVYKERGVNEAMKLMDVVVEKGGRPNIVNFNVLLDGLCKEGRTDEAVQLYKDLRLKGLTPNVGSYNILLRSFCANRRWDEAYGLLVEMASRSIVPSVSTYNILISSLADQGKMDHARQLLDGMFDGPLKPRTMTYTQIIANLCREKNVDEVIKILDQMNQHKIELDETTYNSIAILCEEGLVKEAFSIIEYLGESTCVHDFYQHVISVLCMKGNTYSACHLLYEMTKSGFTPDSSACMPIVAGLCKEGMLKEAFEIFTMVMEEGRIYGPNFATSNQILRTLCKCRRTDLSLEIFKMIIEEGHMPNETTYTILIEGIALENEKDLAYDVLKELHLRGVMSESSMEKLVMSYELEEITKRKILKFDHLPVKFFH